MTYYEAHFTGYADDTGEAIRKVHDWLAWKIMHEDYDSDIGPDDLVFDSMVSIYDNPPDYMADMWVDDETCDG